MARSSQELTLIGRVRAAPDDDGPRLILADWYDEHGDPRGEFIRVQCALARLRPAHPPWAELARREQELRDAHEVEWAEPLHPFVSGWEFRRGMLEGVSLSAEAFLEHAPKIFELAPVLKVRLFEARPHMRTLAESEAIRLPRELDLCGNELGNGGVNVLARSGRLDKLRSLDLSFNGLSDTGLSLLGGSERLANLRELRVNDNGPFGKSGVAALLAGEFGAGLRKLDVSACGLDGDAARTLTRHLGALPSLRRLELHSNRIGDEGAVALANSDAYRRVTGRAGEVNLSSNNIGPVGVRHLAIEPLLTGVSASDLSANLLGDDGVEELLLSPHLDSLRELRLAENRIEAGGAIALADSLMLGRLTRLDLTGNPLTLDGVNAIRFSTNLNWRTTLDLPEATEMTPRAARSLEPLRSRFARRRRRSSS